MLKCTGKANKVEREDIMKPCVLFSPIGRTDPVRDGFDGPFLHILRHYPVKKAVLYLTSETYEIHQRDNRYCELAAKVSPETEIELCTDDKVVNAHAFEIYDKPFQEAIEELHKENKECEILVNISSGTPQMEASLYLLKATLPFPIRAIQVTSPANRSNDSTHLDRNEVQNLEMLYASLKDNDPDARNRCVEVHCENAQAKFLKKNIEALIEHHNYAAALTLTKDAQDLFTKEAIQMLNAAQCRIALQTDQAIQDLPGSCFEEMNAGAKEAYEYILMLDTLVKREAYGDYARAISPALVAMLQLALCKQAGMDILKLCKRKKDAVGAEWIIDPALVEQQDKGMYRFLQNGYAKNDGGFRKSPLNADIMIKVLEYYRTIKRRKDIDTEDFKKLRTFERSVRNAAAHQITPITEQQILVWTDNLLTVSEAQSLLKQCFVSVCGKVYRWNGYERTNACLKQELEKMV